MTGFLPLLKEEAIPSIISNTKYNKGSKIVFTKLDKILKYVRKKDRSIKGWYYIKIDTKKDKLNIDDDSIYIKDSFFIEIPYRIKLNDRIPIPLEFRNSIWKRIPGFSKYLASNDGYILNIKTGNRTKGVTAGHYNKVSLFKDGRSISKMEYVHILICTTFHGPRPKGNYVVMHKDDNKFNNNETNLKWGTQSQNIKDVWNKRNKDNKNET